MRAFFVLGVLVTAIMVSVPSASATTRTVSRDYVGVTGDSITVNCGGATLAGPGLGGGCFAVAATDLHVSIAISDLSDSAISGEYHFTNAAGMGLDSYPAICGSAADIPVPLGATKLTIYIDEAFAPLDCTDFNPGTAGTITATFSDV